MPSRSLATSGRLLSLPCPPPSALWPPAGFRHPPPPTVFVFPPPRSVFELSRRDTPWASRHGLADPRTDRSERRAVRTLATSRVWVRSACERGRRRRMVLARHARRQEARTRGMDQGLRGGCRAQRTRRSHVPPDARLYGKKASGTLGRRRWVVLTETRAVGGARGGRDRSDGALARQHHVGASAASRRAHDGV